MSEIFAIEKILDERRGKHGKKEYLIHLKGYSIERSTWEPEENLVLDSNAEDCSEAEEFEVEDILDRRLNDSGIQEFLIHWKGYSQEESTWEPESHLSKDVLRGFRLRESKRKLARSKRKRNHEEDDISEFDPEDEARPSSKRRKSGPKENSRSRMPSFPTACNRHPAVSSSLTPLDAGRHTSRSAQC